MFLFKKITIYTNSFNLKTGVGLLAGEHKGGGACDGRRRVWYHTREPTHPKTQSHAAAQGQGGDSKPTSM